MSKRGEIRLASPCNIWALALDDVSRLKAVHAGEEVAVVAAETPLQAFDAIRAIEVEYEVLPFVIDDEAALDPSAPAVQEGGNIVGEPSVRERGDLAAGFAEAELALRASAGMPPFVRLVRFITRHRSADRARRGGELLAEHLRGLFGGEADVKFIGPMQAGIFKVRGQFRFELNCHCRRPGRLQSALAGRMHELSKQVAAELIVDVDPVNLL